MVVDVMGSALKNVVNTILKFGGIAIKLPVKIAQYAGRMAQKVAKTIWDKAMKMKNYMTKVAHHVKDFAQRNSHFFSFMGAFLRFTPVIMLCGIIIAMFAGAFEYVVIGIAFIAIAFLRIIFFVMSL